MSTKVVPADDKIFSNLAGIEHVKDRGAKAPFNEARIKLHARDITVSTVGWLPENFSHFVSADLSHWVRQATYDTSDETFEHTFLDDLANANKVGHVPIPRTILVTPFTFDGHQQARSVTSIDMLYVTDRDHLTNVPAKLGLFYCVLTNADRISEMLDKGWMTLFEFAAFVAPMSLNPAKQLLHYLSGLVMARGFNLYPCVYAALRTLHCTTLTLQSFQNVYASRILNQAGVLPHGNIVVTGGSADGKSTAAGVLTLNMLTHLRTPYIDAMNDHYPLKKSFNPDRWYALLSGKIGEPVHYQSMSTPKEYGRKMAIPSPVVLIDSTRELMRDWDLGATTAGGVSAGFYALIGLIDVIGKIEAKWFITVLHHGTIKSGEALNMFKGVIAGSSTMVFAIEGGVYNLDFRGMVSELVAKELRISGLTLAFNKDGRLESEPAVALSDSEREAKKLAMSFGIILG